MNLALDASYSFGRELSGVGVYSRELLWHLAKVHPERRFHWLYRPNRFLRAWGNPKPPLVRRGILFDHAGARRGLFHGLNQRLPRRRYPFQVATFHDLFVLTGEYSTPEFRKRFAAQARHAAAEADRIIAVSEFTAGQVQALLGVERSRLRVIHHGVVPRQYPQLAREKIVLSLGAIQKRKNSARLIQAFRTMPKDWRLILAGAQGFGSEAILSENEDPRVEITGYISESQVAQLLARASIFAFPSLDEGFGMPVLEAMSAGLPVITSNRSALPEVAGEAAVLIDPENVDGLAGALNWLADHPEERARLSSLGRVQAAGFTWQHAAQQTWDVYCELTSLPQRQFSAPSGSADPG